jgi:hypothetical protein
MIEPRQIAEFGHQADRGGELDAAQRLQCFNDRVEPPLRRCFTQRRLQPRALGEPVFSLWSLISAQDLGGRGLMRSTGELLREHAQSASTVRCRCRRRGRWMKCLPRSGRFIKQDA